MSVTKSMYRNDRNIATPTMALQDVVNGGVVDCFSWINEDRFIFRELFDECRELNCRLPINLNLSNRGTVLGRLEAPFPFVRSGMRKGSMT